MDEWNLEAEKITGYDRNEVMGRDLVANMIGDDYKASLGEVLTNALRGEETANFEFSLCSKSGDRFDILVNTNTRHDIAGQIIGAIGAG